MIQTDIKSFLLQLAKDNSDNKIGLLLATNYENFTQEKTKEKLFEFILAKYEDIPENINLIEPDKDLSHATEDLFGKDFRIRGVQLSNLRGIPEEDSDGVSFGIDFTDGGENNNAIILANNGVGKSSVFAALEMVYSQEIGERKLRQSEIPSLKDFNEYLERFNSENKPECTVFTNSGKFNLTNPVFKNKLDLQKFKPANHFISDFDIYAFGQVDYGPNEKNSNSFHNITARSLGLSNFLSLKDQLLSLRNYRRNKEKKEFESLDKELAKNEQLLKESKQKLFDFQTELEQLEKGESKIPAKSNESKSKLLDYSQISFESTQNADFYLQIIEDYRNHLVEFEEKNSNVNLVNEKSFLELGKQLMNENDDCPFCKNSNSSQDKILQLVEERILDIKSKEYLLNRLSEKLKETSRFFLDLFKTIRFIYSRVSIERGDLYFDELRPLQEKGEKIYINPKFIAIAEDFELFEKLESYENRNSLRVSDFENFRATLNWIEKLNLKEIIKSIRDYLNIRKKSFEDFLQNKVNADNGLLDEKYQLKKEIETISVQIKGFEDKRNTLPAQLDLARNEYEKVKEINSSLEKYFLYYDSEFSKIISESFKPLQGTIEVIMKDYLKEENIEIKINIQKIITPIENEAIEKEIITATLIDQKTGKSITPDRYFNTFRYKLFCLMVSLSLALANRKIYQVNLPFVLDDLFSSSDFVNKNSFSRFFSKIILLFQEHTPEMDLQFILFTHDDVIFRNAMDSITEIALGEEKRNLITETKVGRMFKPEDKPSKTSLLDGEYEFWNLFYELPKNIDQNLKKEEHNV
ncbi:hypothetical protein QYS48_31655 [Marivirga arenosa]|uniref:Uncharacterized protein n=1 Tax=Marivirga arenosa TaxID=3059076 RepID=A0AA51N4I0_9BACT|nr:hypothetical protein [Marivirga sp. ABR2-2]WMN06117.1 hypothetical protein QYS48_31655 [Marivirga sp. ABR2-2]